MGLLIAVIVLDALVLAAVVVGAVAIRKIGGAASAAEAALNDIRQELPPTLRAAQDALRAVERAAAQTEQELHRVDDVLQLVDRLLTGAALTGVAVKAVRSSRVTLSSVLAGLKEGLRVLRTPTDKTKEDQENV